MRCSKCSSPLRDDARFCPRCGQSVAHAAGATHGKAGHVKAGIPWGGILFLLALLFGPAAVVAGVYSGHGALIYAGIVVSAVAILTVLLGFLL